MATRQPLRQFILECLTVSEKQDLYGAKRCSGFSLVHVAGSQQLELKTIKIGAKAHDPKELAELFEGTAENYAGGIPGVQQFQLLAFFDDSDRPQSFYPFRKSADPDHSGLGTEAPTTSGVTTQLMRHNEALSRINAHHQSEVFRELMTIIREERETNQQLRKEQTEVIELAKELILKQAADQHTRTIELLKLKQSMKDRETFMKLAPPVANRVFGKEIFPQAVADTAIFENLAESLDEDQVKKLAAVLKPEQWALVADRLVQILEAKAKREASEKAIEAETKKTETATVTGNGTGG